MNTRRTHVLLLAAAIAVLPACQGGPAPVFQTAEDPVTSIPATEVPADLPACADRFGEVSAWPTPEIVLAVEGRPGLGVMLLDERMACLGRLEVLRNRLPRDAVELELPESTRPIDGVATPADDSNPLPAQPGVAQGDQAALTGPIDDSNPLPARPDHSPQGQSQASSPINDSNPLPAGPTPDPDWEKHTSHRLTGL